MANIRVDLDYIIEDGTEIKFRSPADCSAITGLVVYYPGASGATTSKVFMLADAHGNNVGDIDHLFAENVVVKVILDVTSSVAFIQNADTNAYLEAQLAGKVPTSRTVNGKALTGNITLSASDVGAVSNNMGKVTGAVDVVGDSWNSFGFTSTDAKSRGSMMISNGNRIHFNQQQTGASAAERYQLPALESSLTADMWYRIITTKAAKVLWTNASTGSAFAAQTISVNGLSNCECIAVLFGRVTGNSNSTFPLIAHKNVSLSTNTNASAVRYDTTTKTLYSSERWTTINFSNNTITFQAGSQNGAQNNDRAIPIAVVGLY